jgi:hypothetical protein
MTHVLAMAGCLALWLASTPALAASTVTLLNDAPLVFGQKVVGPIPTGRSGHVTLFGATTLPASAGMPPQVQCSFVLDGASDFNAPGAVAITGEIVPGSGFFSNAPVPTPVAGPQMLCAISCGVTSCGSYTATLKALFTR